ncbi:MAG TPA: PHB depolymerase family esterase [Solimonas sp.]
MNASPRFPRYLSLTLSALAIMVAGCLMPATSVQAQKPGSTSEYEFRSGLLMRSYRLYVPSNYQAGKPVPLLVALHGGFGTGKNMEDVSGFDRVADARGLIVVYPDGVSRAWNAGTCCAKPMENGVRDVMFIQNLIADVKTKVAVDAKRVYGAGFSNGAMMVHRVACEAPGTFTAIAAVAGGIMLKDCSTKTPTPALLIQGRADPRIPWDGGEFEGNYRPSIKEIVANLRVRNGCSAEETVVEQNDVATCTALKGCKSGQDVQWCGLAGVGHQWAGGKTLLPGLLGKNTDRYNASAKIVDFFLKHPG